MMATALATADPDEPIDSSTARRHGIATLPRLSLDFRRRAAAPPDDEDGADLAIESLIGEGGMGQVFLARQRSLGREVAVKTTRTGAPADVTAALVSEGRIAGQLEHPSIVPVHVLGLDGTGRPAIVMKRIEGIAYDALIRDPTHPAWEDWDGERGDRLPGHLQILTQICNALHYAHSHGIVHRDLKPENVLIGRFGDVYVADWGIAVPMDDPPDGRLCGTPGYMAPEMAWGEAVDARTDVYLLGATLHEVLTGRPRHDAPTFAGAMELAVASAPFDYDDDVPEPLAALANRACSSEPDNRPATARAFRDALTAFVGRRDSMVLADEARARLDRVIELAASPLGEDGAREIDQHSAAARFGFEQALARWEDNEDAKEGLSSLDTALQARRARAAELEAMAHERDPRVASQARAIGLSVLMAVSLVALWSTLTGDQTPETFAMVAYPTTILAVILVGLYVGRRALLRNAFNRQVVGTLVVALALIVYSRLLAFVVPVSAAEVLTRDSLVAAAVFTIATFTLVRWAAWVVVIMLATAFGCAWLPERALQVFSAGTILSIAVATAASWRQRGS